MYIFSTDPEKEIKYFKKYRENKKEYNYHGLLYFIMLLMVVVIGFLWMEKEDNRKNIAEIKTRLNCEGSYSWGEYIKYSEANRRRRRNRRR